MSNYWVFGYGSLIWSPGFPYEEAIPARLDGGHRALCVRSTRYRGTRSRPGLVFGLDFGGHCVGMAFRISRDQFPCARVYLQKRELINGVYRGMFKSIRLLDGSERYVTALCYVANCNSPLYVNRLPYEYQAYILRTRSGCNGRNIDYFLNTLFHLRDLDIYDTHLERLSVMVRCKK